MAAYGLVDPCHAFWLTNPLTTMLMAKKLGHETVLWVHPLRAFPLRGALGARYLQLLGRLTGSPFPLPRLLEAQHADRLARWLGRRLRDGRPVVVDTVPSSAVRVAVAARAAGISLERVTFFLQSEPVTPARHRHIVDSGAGDRLLHLDRDVEHGRVVRRVGCRRRPPPVR
jgi:hypothetical protein